MAGIGSILGKGLQEIPAPRKTEIPEQKIIEPEITTPEEPIKDSFDLEDDFATEENMKKIIEKDGIEQAEIKMRAALKRKRELLDKRKKAHTRLLNTIETHPNGELAGLDGIISNDTYAKASNSNVEYKQKALQGYAEKFMPEAKQQLSTTFLGLKRDEELSNAVVRAVIDGDTTNPTATKLGAEISKSLEFLRERFNRFGGDVGSLKKGGYLPQIHDAQKIRTTKKDEWIKFIETRVDADNQRMMQNGSLNLSNVYDNISTGGLARQIKSGKESTGGKGKSVANKHAEERVLNFKDADSWIEYQQKFGNKDIMATIDDHVRRMTTDISMIEVLGPNPEAMFKTLSDSVVAKRTMKGDENPSQGLDMTKKMWNVVSGKVDRDAGEFIGSGFLQTTRAMNTASLLTGAALSTVTDPLLGAINAGFKGMNPMTTLGSYVKNFAKSASKKGFEEQQIMGLGADVFSSEVTKRFSELGDGFWSKASEAVMRATFMNTLTESARMAFKAQFMKKLLKGRKIESLTQDEHIKLLEEVQEASDYAVIMGNSRSRAISTQGEAKGTIVGEISRSSMQFFTFPMTFMVMQGAKITRQGTIGSRISYGAALFSVMTIGGAIAMMGKDASKGYTVREGGNPFSDDDTKDKLKFWGAAATQGGGVGIIGDFLFSDVNRFGQGKGVTALGPTAGLIGDAFDLTYGNVQKAFDPDNPETHFGEEATEFANRHMNPLNVWYVGALWEQYLVRNVKIMLDDDYERKEKRKLRKRRKEYGQEKFEWLQD